MPWEHAVIGYIGYSVFVHVVYRESPTTGETLVVVFASVLPDLIDKPLAWQFNVFSSGHALGHSLFFAIPLSLALLVLAWLRGQRRYGEAFAIGYLLHLPADVFPQYLLDGEFKFHRVVWPVVRDENGNGAGFREEFMDNFEGYARSIGEQVASGNPDPYLILVLGFWIFGVLLWIYDGMPVGREIYGAVRRAVRAVARGIWRN